MIFSATNVANTPTTDTTATKSNAATDPNAAQDRFLKLLVAQLNNQDPMNPLDNAQMTSQMAQINTVTGIQQLNQTMQARRFDHWPLCCDRRQPSQRATRHWQGNV